MSENKNTCDKCKEATAPAQVPFYVFESVQYRHEREIARYRILCGVLAAVTVLTNAAWVMHLFGVF